MTTLAGKRILLIVSGSVAAYKALELARLLRKAGAGVTGLLTAAGARFVTPHALQAITGGHVHEDLWSLADEAMSRMVRRFPSSCDTMRIWPPTAASRLTRSASHADSSSRLCAASRASLSRSQ